MNIYDIHRADTQSSEEAFAWYRQNIRHLMNLRPYDIVDTERQNLIGYRVASRNQFLWIGRLFFLFYDPKGKDTLPYYDKFPLVMPITTFKNGFLGLNFHYLSPRHRTILLERLLSLRSNQTMDDTTRIRLKYSILKNTAKYKHHKPTIKRYLNGRVKSQFRRIDADEFTAATLLPVARFKKESVGTVWADSRKMI